jgi:hypothetical protein
MRKLDMTQKAFIFMACFFAAVTVSGVALGQSYSELWGKNGENWTPDSRLPDFSFAGYRFGEVPLPKVKVSANVKDFGAKGDGQTDDTEAFKQAITETKDGAIFIPEGRYLITDILWIKKSNIVLRGEGRDKSVLHFPRELEDVRPNMGATSSGSPTSNYSWSGGFVWVQGSLKSETISDITSEHKRGEKSFTVSRAEGLKPGQRVRVQITDDAQKSLLNHLYSEDSGKIEKITDTVSVTMVSRIAAVEGNRITLERPLRWDIRKDWTPRLQTFMPSVSEVGIEDLGFSFPVKPYKGHFTEKGMNAIAMSHGYDCWIRNVRISNCDSGIFMAGMFNTIDQLLIDGTRETTKGDTGHHGVTLGQDSLLQNFEFQTKFIHDLTVTNFQNGNVFKNGKGLNLSFDHHKRAPFENLFSNIDVGDGDLIWRSGGGDKIGKHSAARGTFWCIHSKSDILRPHPEFGPDSLNIVGVKTGAASIKNPDGKWFESIAPSELHPADLHAAQLAKRLGIPPSNPADAK